MDDEQRYQAAASKDARFDGVFFVAVTTTGIYCRPSCPAMTPRRENVRFYSTSAAAQQTGFPVWVDVMLPAGCRSITSGRPATAAMGSELDIPFPNNARSGTMP